MELTPRKQRNLLDKVGGVGPEVYMCYMHTRVLHRSHARMGGCLGRLRNPAKA